MIAVPSNARFLVARRPIDFRCGHDRLAALVTQALAEDPFCGTIFVFRSKRADRLKVLVWDGSGLWLHDKRLEQGAFTWPAIADGAITLTPAQLTLLLAGLDWRKVTPKAIKRPLKSG